MHISVISVRMTSQYPLVAVGAETATHWLDCWGICAPAPPLTLTETAGSASAVGCSSSHPLAGKSRHPSIETVLWVAWPRSRTDLSGTSIDSALIHWELNHRDWIKLRIGAGSSSLLARQWLILKKIYIRQGFIRVCCNERFYLAYISNK